MAAWLTTAHELLHSPAGVGALAGLLAAVRVDYEAFRAWDEWQDLQSYQWGLASFRWVKGAVIGAISALGVSAVL